MRTKPSSDSNKTAFAVIQQVIEAGEAEPSKNPAAVALGRRGGLKGGKARAKALSAEERSEIASKAAKARWKAKKKS